MASKFDPIPPTFNVADARARAVLDALARNWTLAQASFIDDARAQTIASDTVRAALGTGGGQGSAAAGVGDQLANSALFQQLITRLQQQFQSTDTTTGTTSGYVSLSVATANGFAGTVALASITPSITLTTSVTGLLKGNGTAMSAAAAGTDYVIPTAPDLTNAKLLGTVYCQQPAVTSKAAAATLTIAELLTGIIQYTGGVANLTLPTGTLIEAGVLAGLAVDRAFDFSVINTGAGAATLVTAAGLTLVGSMVVANGVSGIFRARKTAANTYSVYRLA